jgi:hypothetical protein
MRDIAELVFGGEPAEPRRLREPGELFAPLDEHLCDGPPAPSGDWCQTTPGDATLEWFARTLGIRARKHR